MRQTIFGLSEKPRQGSAIKSFFQMAKLGGIDLAEVAREKRESNYANCANCATVPSGKNMQKSSKMRVFDDFDSNLAIGKLAKVAKTSSCQTFSDKLNRSDFPMFLAPVFDGQADAVGVDKMLLGALNLISGILPDSLYSIYDRRKIHAPLYNIVYGRFATSKGDLEAVKQIVAPIKHEMRRKYEAEKARYEEAKAEWDGKGKKERGRRTHRTCAWRHDHQIFSARQVKVWHLHKDR